MKIRIKERESNTLIDDNPLDDIPSVSLDIDDNGVMKIELTAFFHDSSNGKVPLLLSNPALQEVVMKAIQLESQKAFRRAVHGVLGIPYGLKEEETPEEQPSPEEIPSTDGKQFQIVGTLITNTKENPQTDILSAIRSLPGVTIVNSKATQPNISSDNQVRYQAGIDIKIDTHSLKGDVKEGIKDIIKQIKEIPGVIELKIIPKAKVTKPY